MAVADMPIPGMAPPFLHDIEDGVHLSQLPVIVNYVSTKLGLLPAGLAKQAVALKVMEDANDLLAEMTRSNGAQMWDKAAWLAFVDPDKGRFVRWLQIFEQLGTQYGLTTEAGFYLGTESATMADLVVFALFHTMERCLPELKAVLRQHAPRVMGLCDRLLASSAGLQAMVDQQSGKNMWCGGYIEKSIRAMLDGSFTVIEVPSAVAH